VPYRRLLAPVSSSGGKHPRTSHICSCRATTDDFAISYFDFFFFFFFFRSAEATIGPYTCCNQGCTAVARQLQIQSICRHNTITRQSNSTINQHVTQADNMLNYRRDWNPPPREAKGNPPIEVTSPLPWGLIYHLLVVFHSIVGTMCPGPLHRLNHFPSSMDSGTATAEPRLDCSRLSRGNGPLRKEKERITLECRAFALHPRGYSHRDYRCTTWYRIGGRLTICRLLGPQPTGLTPGAPPRCPSRNHDFRRRHG
jgi:hypothetical protein